MKEYLSLYIILILWISVFFLLISRFLYSLRTADITLAERKKKDQAERRSQKRYFVKPYWKLCKEHYNHPLRQGELAFMNSNICEICTIRGAVNE